MGDYGIKVSIPGKGITTTDIRELLLSSKFPMLKYHSDNTNSITLVSGDTNKYVDFTHGLGYVPAFISYIKSGDYIYNINSINDTSLYGAYSWADSTKVRCGFGYYTGAHNQLNYAQTVDTNYNFYDERYGQTNYIVIGRRYGDYRNSALRFTDVAIPKNATIVSAQLSVVKEYGGGTGDLKFDTYGIDEDNTANFSSNPMGRSQTTATTYVGANITNTRFDVNVKSIVEEITTRNGWASGNAMGFIFRTFNPSTDDLYLEDDIGGSSSYLTIVAYSGTNTTYYFRSIIFKDKIV